MLEILDCVQGSDEWLRARMGRPTASNFATLIASGKGGSESLTRRTYMFKLAGEIITGEPSENYKGADMERGNAMEAEARERYAFERNADPQLVGFITNGPKGCAPDALLGDVGMLEVKTAAPHVLIDALLRGEVPPAHRAQCQGNLWVAEREWIDVIIYWPKMPPLIRRMGRDEEYIGRLSDAVVQFNQELAVLVERIKGYGREA